MALATAATLIASTSAQGTSPYGALKISIASDTLRFVGAVGSSQAYMQYMAAKDDASSKVTTCAIPTSNDGEIGHWVSKTNMRELVALWPTTSATSCTDAELDKWKTAFEAHLAANKATYSDNTITVTAVSGEDLTTYDDCKGADGKYVTAGDPGDVVGCKSVLGNVGMKCQASSECGTNQCDPFNNGKVCWGQPTIAISFGIETTKDPFAGALGSSTGYMQYNSARTAANAVVPECGQSAEGYNEVGHWVTNKNMKELKAVWPITGFGCTAEKLTAWNTAFKEKLAASTNTVVTDNQVKLKGGDATTAALDTHNDCLITPAPTGNTLLWACAGQTNAPTGCKSVLCNVDHPCSADGQCGTNKCAEKEINEVKAKVCNDAFGIGSWAQVGAPIAMALGAAVVGLGLF